ncbi:MAG: hypothetical protein ABIO81_10160 [Ginsengibacter sp.]
MLPSQMRYLLLINLLFALPGCVPMHKQMTTITEDARYIQRFIPAFHSALYKTTVDVVGNHLSGLLLIKKMPDNSIRMVFSNEMGLTFFDFEFAADGNFKVHSVIKKMNKKSVLKTLQHDFELILMNRLDYANASVKTNEGLRWFVFPKAKGFNYYITDSAVTSLLRMERASSKKVIVQAIMKNYINGIPDTIGISHKTFSFNIGLNRIER